ncbi:MAG TPA: trypsin-like peptidase domain-containing protein [Gemmatimonadaceae bacterium]|nr:trypsin-like peptidase domain-containing protein [Gemmatimonadaceae bacterium]
MITRTLVLSLLTLTVACGESSREDTALAVNTARAASAPRSSAADSSLVTQRRSAITEAVARVAPTVVTVQTEVVDRSTDPFDVFNGASERILPGLGSGFIVRADGVIATNAHVVAGANTISVAMRDGTTYPARLLGKDETNDIAVLKIDAKGLPVAPLGQSDDLIIGEWVIAIGNPYGFLLGNSEPSVTVGVISGTGRNLVARSQGSAMYVDMIQTDASINPGNSGGPLVNALGDIVGMNSSIFTPSGGSIGLGFAIPVNRVRHVTEDLLAHGTVRRPWIGLKPELPEGPSQRETLRNGVTVGAVVPGSPADRAGIRRGDVLVRSRSRTIRNAFDWEAELLDLRVGDQVPLVIKRGAREVPVRVTIADLPEVSAAKVAVLKELELVTLTPAIRVDRGIRSPKGALIYNLSERVSDELGLAKGDVIVQINRLPIETANDAARALDAAAGRETIHMFFERGGRIYSTDFMIR